MKFKCLQADILKSIQDVQYIIENKNTLPILSNILLDVQEKEVLIVATDLEIGIKSSFPATIKKKGKIAIPAKKFSEIIHELPEENIDVELIGENLVGIKCASISFTLNAVSPDDFPKFPSYQEDKYLIINSQIFRELINKTVFSVSHDESRYILNGILIEKEKGDIRLVATDGHRLALNTEGLKKDNLGENLKIIVPSKTMKEVSRLLTGTDGDLKIIIEEKQIIFFINNTILISRLIDGQFPDYKRVIPAGIESSFKISREKILQTTKRISILTSSKNTAVTYQLKPGILNIFIRNPEEGEANETLNIDYNGPEMEVGYNYRYLLDIYKNLDCEELVFEFTKPLNPGVIKPKSEKNSIYIIMPMRI